MKENSFVSADDIRSAFSAAMSLMYREEVPAYGTLMELVARVNGETLSADATLKGRLKRPICSNAFPRSVTARSVSARRRSFR